ncbi:MarR family winged helix-turn-helix transcriptional regulator [Goodfellowiella coeruleoviolacea]|uniref:Transcriptional regulator, MarR family n=1 Tax=Goodfellowiella coeruleoviolacea TaxID=334858 RepID=A0AAE3KIZ6_9PSEU|nr:MarR family transcriptional regulator [Goodfellowiella coeruleoviolacea]MCP2169025.1 transcriptional regulator, MarR family [Goodfellowiella coeruleoviolacea]
MAEQTRWLTEREQRAWLAFLAMERLLDEALDRQLQRDAGMSHAYYRILAILSAAPNHTLRMSELAEQDRASQSRLTHAINRLEQAGWVRREKGATDRRVVHAQLTEAGYEVLRQTAPGHVEAVRANLFDQLSEEQVDQLRNICEAVLTKLEADHGPARVPRRD